jgi:hypothetical protein
MPYSSVRATAVAAVHAALRRFPCLAPAVLPTYLAAIAGAPAPPAAAKLMSAGSLADVAKADGEITKFYEVALRDAALRDQLPAGAVGKGAAAPEMAEGGKAGEASAASAAAKESANDGRVAGACAALSGSIEVLRHAFRDPVAWGALLRAAMASRTHGSSACEDALSGLLMQARGRADRFGGRLGLKFGANAFLHCSFPATDLATHTHP